LPSIGKQPVFLTPSPDPAPSGCAGYHKALVSYE
jgi:hypothetical protein